MDIQKTMSAMFTVDGLELKTSCNLIGSSFRIIPYHYRFSMGTFKEQPMH